MPVTVHMRREVGAAQLAQQLQRGRAIHLVADHGVAEETELLGVVYG